MRDMKKAILLAIMSWCPLAIADTQMYEGITATPIPLEQRSATILGQNYLINVGNDDRYSIPLFVNPSAEVEIKPLVGDLAAFESFHYGTYQRDLWRNTFPVAEIS